jgi:hypothetical protein
MSVFTRESCAGDTTDAVKVTSMRVAVAIALMTAIVAGPSTSGAAENDIDGDGVPDLVLGAVQPGVEGTVIVDRSAGSDEVLTARSPEGLVHNPAGFGAVFTIADFDSDGFDDIAIGGHHERVPWPTGRGPFGAVTVMYGSMGNFERSQVLVPAQSLSFGLALTSGDFNGDGFADLAAFSAFDATVRYSSSGDVRVFYGGPDGLTRDRRQLLTQATPGIPGQPERYDFFGQVLASGSIDGDAYDDLVIGVPYEDIGEVRNAGSVVVVRGSVFGLIPSWSSRWSKGSSQLGGRATTNDHVGSSLCVGDFDGDSFGDIAIGVPEEDIGVASGAGAVRILRGSAAGPTNVGRQVWTQNTHNVEGLSERLDAFGDVCAAGDFNDDGFDDLMVSAPLDRRGTGRGVVNVLFGTPAGLSAFGDVQIAPPSSDALLGGDLAAFDVDGDGIDEVLVAGGTLNSSFVLIASGGTPPFATTTTRAGDPYHRFTLPS